MMQTKKSDNEWFTNSTEKLVKNVGSRTSILIEGCSVRGAFESKGDFELNGYIEGDVVVEGVLTVGESAVVRANIRARSAVIFGRVIGDLLVSDRIELHAGAQVRGNIKTRKLLIHDGVVFDGRCEMTVEKNPDEEVS
jgi:cytoskeletal protein CcmA (bactofilin family)